MSWKRNSICVPGKGYVNKLIVIDARSVDLITEILQSIPRHLFALQIWEGICKTRSFPASGRADTTFVVYYH